MAARKGEGEKKERKSRGGEAFICVVPAEFKLHEKKEERKGEGRKERDGILINDLFPLCRKRTVEAKEKGKKREKMGIWRWCHRFSPFFREGRKERGNGTIEPSLSQGKKGKKKKRRGGVFLSPPRASQLGEGRGEEGRGGKGEKDERDSFFASPFFRDERR